MSNKKTSFGFIISLVICSFFCFPLILKAAPDATTGSSTPSNQPAESTTIAADGGCEGGNAEACLKQGKPGEIMKVLEIGLNFLAGLVLVASVIMIIVGGIQYTSSGGNPQAVSAAKQKIMNVFIGLLAFVFLYAFLQWLIPGGIFTF